MNKRNYLVLILNTFNYLINVIIEITSFYFIKLVN